MGGAVSLALAPLQRCRGCVVGAVSLGVGRCRVGRGPWAVGRGWYVVWALRRSMRPVVAWAVALHHRRRRVGRAVVGRDGVGRVDRGDVIVVVRALRRGAGRGRVGGSRVTVIRRKRRRKAVTWSMRFSCVKQRAARKRWLGKGRREPERWSVARDVAAASPPEHRLDGPVRRVLRGWELSLRCWR